MTRLWLFLALAPAQAGAFSLGFPLECTLGDSCFVQQFMDRDPSPGATDFTCGPLSYDGHSGTDIAVPTLADMRNGIPVLAAAAGTVRGTRDGMPDISRRDPSAPALDGRDCGNGLVIDHGDGWETQYCHMAEGSIAVKEGERLAPGARLGLIGLSGNTEFPHLHFSVRKDGAEIDPFDPDGSATCGEGPVPSLWSMPFPYTPGGIVGAGFSTRIPEWEAIKAGLQEPPFPATAPALVVWAHSFGTRKDDHLHFTITGPQGQVLDETVVLEKPTAQGFRAVGKRLRAPKWPAGRYEGRIVLRRDEQVLSDVTVALDIP